MRTREGRRERERTRDTRTIFLWVKCLSKFTHRPKDCDAFSGLCSVLFCNADSVEDTKTIDSANRSGEKNDLEVTEVSTSSKKISNLRY